MIKYEVGDIINAGLTAKIDVLVHGCNCFCTMGRGLALQIKIKFPLAYHRADLLTKRGDKNKLGTYSYYRYNIINSNTGEIHHLYIVNAYTQYYYSHHIKVLDEAALKNVLQLIKNDFTGLRIGIPKIGCTNAGGDWDDVLPIVKNELYDEDVTVFTLK